MAPPKGSWDAKFYAFQKLTKLAEKLMPNTCQYTREQADAIHQTAREMAKDLTSGEYSYRG